MTLIRFRLRTLLIVLAIGPALCYSIAVLSGTAAGRGAFSPDSLDYTWRSEVVLVGTDSPVVRSKWKHHDHELVRFLINKGYWTKSETNSPRWLFLFHSSSSWRDGESALHRSFFWKREFWMEWTNKHPQQATQFWPHVLALLRSGKEYQAVQLLNEVIHSPR